MKRLIAFSLGMGIVLLGARAGAQEIETFDSPNVGMGGVNFAWKGSPSASWVSPNGSITENSTNVEITSTTGYGTAYHDFYSQDTSPTVSVSPTGMLQLDVTVNSGDIGPFIDLQDGEGDVWQYFYGYGLVGSDNAPPQEPGETITELGNNEVLLDVPLSQPHNNGSSLTFDFSAIVNFRLEDDPGSNPAYDISLNDLSVVAAPEPASLSFAAAGLLLAVRRRRA